MARRNAQQVQYRGKTFRSKLELWIWKVIAKIKRGTKIKITYETEKIPYVIRRNYVPDFIVRFQDGRKMYIEAKGYFSPSDRAKLKAVKESNPEMDLRIVFARDNSLRSGSRSSYSTWCDKLEIPWAINSPPKEWFV